MFRCRFHKLRFFRAFSKVFIKFSEASMWWRISNKSNQMDALLCALNISALLGRMKIVTREFFIIFHPSDACFEDYGVANFLHQRGCFCASFSGKKEFQIAGNFRISNFKKLGASFEKGLLIARTQYGEKASHRISRRFPQHSIKSS